MEYVRVYVGCEWKSQRVCDFHFQPQYTIDITVSRFCEPIQTSKQIAHIDVDWLF